MRPFAIMLSVVVFSWAAMGAAEAQEDVIQEALQDCSTELEEYCSTVTPGGGRLVSCAKAHEDKLSPQCTYAINRAGFWVSFVAQTITYVASQCGEDALKYCPDVELGEDRVLNCLLENKDGLTKYCQLALQDIGKN